MNFSKSGKMNHFFARAQRSTVALTRRQWLAGLLAVMATSRSWSEERAVDSVRLATTTSVDHSGLLAWLAPQLRREAQVALQVLALGTGKALAVLGRGDADFGITHDPEAEASFLRRYPGWHRQPWLVGRFLLVGPTGDPAGVQGGTVTEGFARIAANGQALFVSRGDQSGTHAREEKLWSAAQIDPRARLGTRYRSVGQGMGPTLMIANEMAAYTLVDEGTWLALRERLANLKVVVASDPLLDNPYAILVRQSAWRDASDPSGRAARWLWEARAAIAHGFVLHGARPLRPAP